MNVVNKDDNDNTEEYLLGGRYAITELLSSGTYGSVFNAIDVRNNEKFAIKLIKDGYSAKLGLSSLLIREITIMNMLRDNPYIACLKEVLIKKGPTDDIVALVLPLADCDLKTWMPRHEYTLTDIQRIMFQITSAINFMHSNYIIHRDIKPSNCLIDFDGKIVKVTDFGLSRVMNDERNIGYSWPIGTTEYCAPELLLNSKKYNYAIDIWGLGITFAELMRNGKGLFRIKNSPIKKISRRGSDEEYNYDGGKTLMLIFGLLGTPTSSEHPHLYSLLEVYNTNNVPTTIEIGKRIIKFEKYDDNALELLMHMIELEPSDRIKTELALESPFFENKI